MLFSFMLLQIFLTFKVINILQIEEVRNLCLKKQLERKMQTFWKERLAEICEASRVIIFPFSFQILQ